MNWSLILNGRVFAKLKQFMLSSFYNEKDVTRTEFSEKNLLAHSLLFFSAFLTIRRGCYGIHNISRCEQTSFSIPFLPPHPKHGGKVMFSVCFSVHTWGRGTPVPFSFPDLWFKVLSRGYPSLGWEYPGQGEPPSQDGYPPVQVTLRVDFLAFFCFLQFASHRSDQIKIQLPTD